MLQPTTPPPMITALAARGSIMEYGHTMSALLLTGPSGVGKTTVLRRVAHALAGWRLSGFLTEEIRQRGGRLGFRAVTFDGRAWDMARVDVPGPARVGRYGVDLAVVDHLATLLDPGRAVDVWLVDEIGKMECLSRAFVAAVQALLEGPAPVVATIALRGAGAIDAIKRRSNATLWTVTRATRDALPGQVVAWLGPRRP
jgi:nucleoside-triphosphatase